MVLTDSSRLSRTSRFFIASSNGLPQLFELSLHFTEVWPVAADDAVPGFGLDAPFIGDDECKMRKNAVVAVLFGSEMLLEKGVDLVHGAAKKRRGPRLGQHVGLCHRNCVLRLAGCDLEEW